MNKNKKMITISIIMMAIGAAGGILYYIYSEKSNAYEEQKATEQRSEIKKEISISKEELTKQIKTIDSSIVKKIELSKDEILEQNKESAKRASDKQSKNQEKILSGINDLKNPPRNPNALYRDGEKKGIVKNFVKEGNKFKIGEIEYDKPMKNMNEMFTPFEYKNYIIKIIEVNNLTIMYPPGAKGIKGVILEEKK
jgi:hypothetical protein